MKVKRVGAALCVGLLLGGFSAEAAEYSVDLSEEPEAVPAESTPNSSSDGSDLVVQEPKKEIAEEKVLAPAL